MDRERGNGFEDDSQKPKYPPHIPPEIAAAMDPAELAEQIQMFEQYAKKNKKVKEREEVLSRKSEAPASKNSYFQKESDIEGKPATGFMHGFEKYDTTSAVSTNLKISEPKLRSGQRKAEEDFFSSSTNQNSANQGGAANFDFNFGDSSQ